MAWVRIGVAAIYLACVWLEAVGSKLPENRLPRAALYFVQIAKLFPHAARVTVDYRAEGFFCKDEEWREIDVRPYFPMHADDKENRFYRVMHFYRRHRGTMQALERYLVDSHNRSSSDRIAGVRLSSLRIPLPEPGSRVPRWHRRPMADYQGEERRKNWYWTPESRRRARCAGLEP
jgi:hypothetical protein